MAVDQRTAPASGTMTAGAELRSLARTGTLTIAGVAIFGLCGLGFNVIVARWLGPKGAGLVFEAVAIATIGANVARLGADTGMLQQLPRLKTLGRSGEVRRTVAVGLAPCLAAGIAVAVVLWLLAPPIGSLVLHGRGAQAVPYIRLQAVFVPVWAASVVMLAGTRGLGSTRPYVFLENAGTPLLRIVVALGVVSAGLGGLAISMAWGAPLVMEAVAAVVVLVRMLSRPGGRGLELGAPEPPALPVRGRHRRRRSASAWARAGRVRPLTQVAAEFWSFAGPRSFAGVAAVLVAWLDILLVGALRGPREAGVYSIVSRYVMIGLFAFAAIRIAMGPQLSRLLVAGRRQDAQTVFQSATYWLVSVSWPFYLALAIFAPAMLRVFGHRFALPGATALTILAVAELYDMGTGNITLVLLMGGKSSWNLMNAGACLVVNVALNLVLIPRLGITGAAIAWAAAIFVENTASVLEVRYLLRLSPFGSGYAPIALSAGVLAGIGLGVRTFLGPRLPDLALWVAIGGPVYCGLLWAFRRQLRLGQLTDALLGRREGRLEALPSQPLGPQP